jgi:hypothetical protein
MVVAVVVEGEAVLGGWILSDRIQWVNVVDQTFIWLPSNFLLSAPFVLQVTVMISSEIECEGR